MSKQWFKPSECAAQIGHKTTDVILGAIHDGKLEARERTTTDGRVRYLIHVDAFQHWFDTVWTRPKKRAS